MPLTQITFQDACKLINEATACILDDNALSFPAVNEDCDGDDCIEINYQEEDGPNENTFASEDTYFLDGKKLVIHQGKHRYDVTFLEVVK